jgi:serine/threonine protein kinase
MNYEQQIQPGTFRFAIIGEVGEGGLGRVDEIQVTRSNCSLTVGTRFARKRLNAKWAQHPEMRQRFEREIEMLKGMAHPAIVPFTGENLPEATERFYVMPLYPRSLRHSLAGCAQGMPWTQVANIGVTLAEALDYAHMRGFVHRDLKPENVLVAADGSLVIADWGLGQFIHQHSKVLQHLTRGGMGTEYYCSLEQWSTGRCDAPGDVYSLGMMLGEMMLGSQLAITQGMGIRQDLVATTSTGSRMVQDLLKHMTEFIQTARVQTMRDVAERLGNALRYR